MPHFGIISVLSRYNSHKETQKIGVRLLRFHWMTLDVFGCPLMYQNETKKYQMGVKLLRFLSMTLDVLDDP